MDYGRGSLVVSASTLSAPAGLARHGDTWLPGVYCVSINCRFWNGNRALVRDIRVPAFDCDLASRALASMEVQKNEPGRFR